MAFLPRPAFALACLVAGCMGTDRTSPGTPLGTFAVQAALSADSCGGAPNPWDFSIRLNRDGSTLYWVQGGSPVAGTLDARSRAVMTSEVSVPVRAADAKTKTPECVMERKDTVTLTLGTEAPTATTFSGTLSYRFAARDGSDCLDVAGTAPGAPLTLPCEVTYTLTGARSDAP